MITTRFAPSPTGHLHIGGLRTALYNYLYARLKKGKFLLRIEDTDTKRNSQEALDGILEAFRWVGLEYDSPMLYQSQRLAIYQEYAKKLLDSNKAYYCYLSQEELQQIRENRNANHAELTRKYRDFKGKIPSGIQPCIRIKSPISGNISFLDGIKGEISFQASEIDDFVILRSDGTPTYNFVVAIDDALSGITDLMRGDDHISNTPKQLVVYEALGFAIPRFYHIPMICNEKGQKLSKRDGALSVLEYREAGILPQALLNFLFRLGFSYGDQEIFSLDDMFLCFDPTQINSKASACNFSKLYWLNSEYIKAMENEELSKLINSEILESLKKDSKERAFTLLDELKPRVNNLVDLKKEIYGILHTPIMSCEKDSENLQGNYIPASYDEAMFQKLFKDSQKDILIQSLKDFAQCLIATQEVSIQSNNHSHIQVNPNNPQEFKGFIHAFSENEHSILKQSGFKSSLFMQGLRLALLGKKGGIDLGACIFILGRNETKKRIESFLSSSFFP
ncbi:glutamate--tRNA ligase [Helicobacter didelphidarum]|uniref:Glutamate--tRNA ligase n=1 Tax=Helicobacter didelphidarum TaxID=2040648 RepID=A0A3D8IQW8_9HELI|nr:glutamate--tRNA ligase [Helicobacter didelphidarum]RDU67592.1 glutamate--tRNA ligase [Helicobacter didelphidarum]